MLTDSLERAMALSCNRSFIVQAPAGSGKTELLTKRFLNLLEIVDNPEQIVALTFTKKAAFEMRTRIIQTLAQSNQKNKWGLIENPHRLRIYTIDSFCSQLAKGLPITSGMGGMPDIEDNPEYLYKKAVEQYLASIEQSGEGVAGLCLILQHFHNRYEVVEKLFMAMLTKRDQWLQLVMSGRSHSDKIKVLIQNSLVSIHEEAYAHLTRLLSDEDKNRWLSLARFSAENLSTENPTHAIVACLHLNQFPENTYNHQAIFSGLYELIFTSSGTLRKRVDKNVGFPPTHPEMKKYFSAWIGELEKQPLLVEQLKVLPSLPSIQLDQEEWLLLKALWEGLPILVAHLQLIFKQYNKVDFTEVSLKALQALGEEDNPTDLALILDYQLKHLLVDEFQDTSSIQYQLFEKIVSGWQPNDGRTLFVVGDPMQSIYRFRGAEVGLYLKLQQQGFGFVQPENIRLSSNFRSDKTIVDWVNHAFRSILSKENDMVLGKITYSPSSSTREYELSGVYCYETPSAVQQAKLIFEKIQHIKQADPQASIAILVRARSHADELFYQFSQKNIAYQAIDMLSLKNSQLITELLNLTRVILLTEDKLAWLALFRSPICGLTLADLLMITDINNLSNLSAEAQTRCEKVKKIIIYWQMNQYRLPLYQSIRHLWHSLGFAQLYQDKINANSFFDLLQKWEEGNQFGDFSALEEKIEMLYQGPTDTASDTSIQIMTIHKAKGLEFDYVFIPGLHHAISKEEQPLVIYHEIPYEHHVDWLIAPKYTATKRSMLYDYIHLQSQQKALYETQRILYVAATRAKKQLIWSYVKEQEKDIPPKESFLAMLAPFLMPIKWVGSDNNEIELNAEKIKYTQTQARVLLNTELPWRYVDPLLIPSIEVTEENPLNRPAIQMDEKWSIVGSYLHRLLANWEQAHQLPSEAHHHNLRAMGLAESDCMTAVALLSKMIKQCLQDTKFNWIMDPTHYDIHNEFTLHFVRNRKLQTRIIDKFFVDKNKQFAWIIDFKLTLGSPTPSDHLDQLKEYARLINELGIIGSKTLCFGLYYPYQSYWWEQECSRA